MQRRQRQVYAFIEPELRRRRALWGAWEKGSAQVDGDCDDNKPLDTLRWLDEVAAEKGQPIDVVMGQLAINLAAVHTSASLLVSVIFNLAARPELAQELRNEIASNIGSGEFSWSEVAKKDQLRSLRLMDSVLKETQRFHAPNVIVMKRATVAPTTLSNGTRIPAGVTVGVPVSWMAHPSIYERGQEYDGHRYLRLQDNAPNDSGRWSFVTTSNAHWGFGHGSHACPGRFFASVELKIVLVHLLMAYEWRLEGGKTGAENMPKTTLMVDQMMPDLTARLEFRSRATQS
ncbi:cytochrome p450 [Colletotrichum incanum]|nr:cytochrome p450 [Colletotrichum incanum]